MEIVNLNVAGQQYVVAGELIANQILTDILNMIKVKKIDIAGLAKSLSQEDLLSKLGEMVTYCHGEAVKKRKENGGAVKLERGFATIPLPGIDVPFHSRYLWAGVQRMFCLFSILTPE